MRANLKPFLARLALVALITLGLTVRLSAHDLPADRSLAESVTDNCFTSILAGATPPLAPNNFATNNFDIPTPVSQAAAPPAEDWSRRTLLHYAVRQTSPALAALAGQPGLWKQLNNAADALSTLSKHTQNLLNSTCLKHNNLVVIAPPDFGVAPHPGHKILSVATAQIRNLRDTTSFQHTSLLAIAPPDAGLAPRPSSQALPVATAHAQPAMAGEIYMPYDFHMSDWRFGQFPYHGKTASAPRPAKLPSITGGSSCVPSKSELGDLLGPQFVVYDSTVGGHIVLTIAQASTWQFEMPSATSRFSQLLSAGLKPIQSSVLATTSHGLQRAGQTLLNLSHSLLNISEPQVASGPQAKNR